MSPKVRFQMFIEPRQLEALRRRHDETGAPIGEQVRRAIDEYLSTKKTARKRASTRSQA